MTFRRLAFLALLFFLSFLCWIQWPRAVMFTMAPTELLRLKQGLDEEPDRLALAGAVAGACGWTLPADLAFDPFVLWADLLPAAGQELALAFPVSRTEGLLAILVPRDKGWRIAARLSPDDLGLPTSLTTLTLPGLPRAALVLTDLADQLGGAFSRRENCVIYAVDEVWRKLWIKEIETEAFWNRAWDQPSNQGWIRLTGSADWQSRRTRGGVCLAVSYQNTLAAAAGTPGGRLPEADRFVPTKQANGHEVFQWDPDLGVFILGYARTREATPLRTNRIAAVPSPGIPLPAGQPLAVLADGASDPLALIDQGGFLRVLAAGRTGYVSAASVIRLQERPADLAGAYHAWLFPR